jgi:purine-nucleoside phosphorylase
MKGLRRARLEVRAGSPGVRRVYRSLGFREEGRREGYYGNGEAAVVMGMDMPGRPDVARTAAALYGFFRGAVPRVGVILGSGLGWLAGQAGTRRSTPYDCIPGLEGGLVPGHPGILSMNRRGTVVFLQGRRHHYQGYSGEEVVLLPSALASIGVDTWLLTTSSGAVRSGLETGDAVVIEDHVNLSGCVPCPPPVPPGKVYSPGLMADAFRLARTLDAPVSGGIFGCVSGPAYETAAEVALLAGSGVSVVSMSTVQEALALVSQGCRVLGVALVTNEVARGDSVSHSEVLGAQETVSDRLGRFLPELVEELER